MRNIAIAAGATTAAVVVAMTGLAGPAAAADEWTMPDITGVVLQKAIDEVHAASGNPEFPVNPIDYAHGLNVLNYTNWKVCAQSPKAGVEVTPKQKKVTVYVIRLNATKCYG